MMNKKYIELIFVIILLFPLLFIGLQTQPDWGDDNFQYLSQASNIRHGKFTSETGYIYKEYAKGMGPQAYPSGFPLMLALFGKISNNVFTSALIIIAFCLFLSGIIVFLLIREYISFWASVFLILIFFYSPDVIRLKSEIMSDFPFFFFLILSIFLLQKKGLNSKVILLLISAFSTGFLVCIRSTGWIWIFSLFLFFALQLFPSSRITNTITTHRKLFYVFVVGLTYIIIQVLLFPADTGGYLDQTDQAGFNLFLNNFRLFISFWELFFTDKRIAGMGFLIVGLSLVGIILNFRRHQLIAIFLVIYLSVMFAVWPHFGFRFYMPIIPFMLFFGVIFLQSLFTKLPYSLKNSIWIILTLITLVSYYPENQKAIQYFKVQDSPECKECKETWNYIKNNTHKDAIIAFHRPRALAYYTERKSFILPESNVVDEINNSLSESNADYVLLDLFNREYQESAELYTHKSNHVYLLWKNNRFELYKIN